MTAATLDLTIEAGATFRRTIRVKAGAGADAPPFDLTGWEPRMQVRKDARALGVLLDCRPANGRLTVLDPVGGVLLLDIPDEDTAQLDADGGVYDLIITGDGETRRLLQGKVAISPGVTRG